MLTVESHDTNLGRKQTPVLHRPVGFAARKCYALAYRAGTSLRGQFGISAEVIHCTINVESIGQNGSDFRPIPHQLSCASKTSLAHQTTSTLRLYAITLGLRGGGIGYEKTSIARRDTRPSHGPAHYKANDKYKRRCVSADVPRGQSPLRSGRQNASISATECRSRCSLSHLNLTKLGDTSLSGPRRVRYRRPSQPLENA